MGGPISRAVFEAGAPFLATRLRLARLDVDEAERLDRILEVATRLSAQELHVERVSIWLFDPSQRVLGVHLLYELGAERHTRPEISIEASQYPVYFEQIASSRAVVMDDARTHAASRDMVPSYLEPLGITSMLDAPIYRQGALFGVVCHEHIGPMRVWTTREVDFAASVADMVALYFEEADRARSKKIALAQENFLLRAEHLASVGIVARHIAHDLNNAVAPILMCAAQLKTMLASDPRAVERVKIILDAAEHGAALARKLLGTSIGQPGAREILEVDSLLRDALPLLKTIAGPEVAVVLSCEADGATIEADPIDLMRAIINLMTNSRDAMPAGGQIALRTHADEQSVRVEISDEGHGISEAERDHIFQPFYSTKPNGTGLGLLSVRNVVEDNHGTVDVESTPGTGTTFTLTFPRSTAP